MNPRPALANPALTRPDWLKDSPRDPKLLWLDKNENTDPALLQVTRRVFREVSEVHLFTYPEMAAFYRKLAETENLPPSSLLLTAGSDGVIRQVFEAFVSVGDVVLHTVPTFAMYPVYSMIYGAKAVTLEYAASEHGPRLTVEQIEQALETHRPKLFCLPNPDSPTGTVFNPEQLDRIVRKCREVGSWMLADEAYYPFYPESLALQAATDPRFSHVVVARTFSKAWGLAGLRTGYAVANPETCRFLHQVRPMYEINTIAVGFLERMLDHKSEVLASVKRLNDGKAYFKKAMKELGYQTLDTEGNFTHVAFGAQQAQIFSALEDLVLYRKDFRDACLKGYSRFSTAPEEVFSRVVNSISSVGTMGPRGNVSG